MPLCLPHFSDFGGSPGNSHPVNFWNVMMGLWGRGWDEKIVTPHISPFEGRGSQIYFFPGGHVGCYVIAKNYLAYPLHGRPKKFETVFKNLGVGSWTRIGKWVPIVRMSHDIFGGSEGNYEGLYNPISSIWTLAPYCRNPVMYFYEISGFIVQCEANYSP